jgi:Phage portal protein
MSIVMVMGLFDIFRRPLELTESSVIGLPMVSPWQEGSLTQVMFADLIGAETADAFPLGRDEALSVPAVSKARNLLVSQIARMPLVALPAGSDVPLAEQPTFLYRTNTPVGPYDRMAMTVDDLIFYGLSLWRTVRGSKAQGSAYAPILAAEWVPFDSWGIESAEIYVFDSNRIRSTLGEDEYILFSIPGFSGLLSHGARTIRGARDTERAWTSRIKNPSPLLELHLTEEANLTEEETAELAQTWNTARQSANGATAVTPPGVTLNEMGTNSDAALYLENRNAIRADIAAFLGTRAAMLDGTTGQASLTYTTSQGEQSAFFGLDLPLWTDAISAALSMDKVVPSGQRIRFDRTEQFNPNAVPTSTPTAD